MTTTPSIAVIIAAYNARHTITRAIGSALASPEVAEVIVVDDASTDDTVEVARQSASSDPRLSVIRQDMNQGPSAARNRALRESRSPFIAVLDADDYLFPDRFGAMLADQNWDLCADNILFSRQMPTDGLPVECPDDAAVDGAEGRLTFQTFVEGNISQRKRWRGELGFLKTVMRRDFLDRHGLAYAEQCRLGEDFLLYAQALAKGARFKVLGRCGYGALLRDNSLSSRHGVGDLKALLDAETRMLETYSLSAPQRQALCEHRASTYRKWIHRAVLQEKKANGLLRGMASAIRHPSAGLDILRDRLSRPPEPDFRTRRLLSLADLQRMGQ